MNSDFKELLRQLAENNVRYLIVGGYAVMHYCQPRFTKDLDIWIEPSKPNTRRLMAAFAGFGLPLIAVTPADFERENFQYMIGRAPVLLDFLTSLPGLKFTNCWRTRVTDESEGFPVHYLSRAAVIKAKTTAGRPQDLADLDELRRSGGQ